MPRDGQGTSYASHMETLTALRHRALRLLRGAKKSHQLHSENGAGGFLRLNDSLILRRNMCRGYSPAPG